MLAKPVIKHMDKEGHQLRLFSRSIKNTEGNQNTDIVSGDVFNSDDLKRAVTGCDAIHINLAKTDEARAMEEILLIAKQKAVGLISYISGASVTEQILGTPEIAFEDWLRSRKQKN